MKIFNNKCKYQREMAIMASINVSSNININNLAIMAMKIMKINNGKSENINGDVSARLWRSS